MFFFDSLTNRKTKKTSLFYLIELIFKEKKKLFFYLIPLIVLMAISHSFYVFSLGPLLKSFFSPESPDGKILITHLLPIKENGFLYPYLSSFSLSENLLLVLLPSFLFLSAFIKNFSTYLYQVLINKLSFYFTRIYRDSLFSGIVLKNYKELLEKTPAKWMSIVMNDVFLLQDRLILLLNHSVRDLIILSTSFVILFFLYGKLGISICLGLLLGYFVLNFFSQKISKLTTSFQESLSFMANALLEVRRRYYTIKTSSSEELEISNFENICKNYYYTVLKSYSLKISIPPFLESLGFCFIAFLLYKFDLEDSSKQPESLSFLITFAILASMIRPLKNLGEQIGLAQEIKGALKESAKHIRSFEPEELFLKTNKPSPDYGLYKEIHIKKIFCGLSSEAIVKIEDLFLKPGESYFIYGPSGSGKSTFLKTLAGLHLPLKWEANCTKEYFFSDCHYTPQRSYTFDDSIKDIVLYGHRNKNDITKKQIWLALKSAELSSVVKRLPKKLNTEVSSLKESLSGGQIQRLLLSRIFLSEERILILDEASSHLDGQNNLKLIKNLLRDIKQKNKILIIVHHNVKLASLFDHAFSLENGKLIEIS